MGFPSQIIVANAAGTNKTFDFSNDLASRSKERMLAGTTLVEPTSLITKHAWFTKDVIRYHKATMQARVVRVDTATNKKPYASAGITLDFPDTPGPLVIADLVDCVAYLRNFFLTATPTNITEFITMGKY